MQTEDDDEEPRRALVESWPTLRLLYSGDAGIVEETSRLITPGSVRLGREVTGTTDIPLPHDRCASRVHAAVSLGSGGAPVRLVDGGSRNGTFVNGKRVVECVLEDGDIVRVGNSLLLLRSAPAAQAIDGDVPGLFGVAPAMRQLRHGIAQASTLRSTVLLLGESGTGKEVAAQALHTLSGRRGPLVPVNCAAISESLAESQLFGHVPGAFTGARAAQEGYFRSAHGGTLFLDEIGELPLPLQAKLLRVLEDRQVTPVGSTRALPVDIAVVAATNRDLVAGIARGAFRGDLYARLAQVILRLPPLRARREDILPLLLHFLGAPKPRLSPALAEALLLHPWPFNVRELRQVAAVLQAQRDRDKSGQLDVAIVAEHLLQHARVVALQRPDEPPEQARPRPAPPPTAAAAERLPRPSREELQRLSHEHAGNVSQLARHYGRSRRQIDRWLEQDGLLGKSPRPSGGTRRKGPGKGTA